MDQFTSIMSFQSVVKVVGETDVIAVGIDFALQDINVIERHWFEKEWLA